MDLLHRETLCSSRIGAPLGVIMADLDYFKNVNDSYGHPTGDVLLREVARRLLGSLRNYDYVGRSGEEEFLIVLAECAPSDLIVTAERMRAHVSEKPVDTDSGPISVTVSIGVPAQRFLDSKLPVEGELVRAAPILLFIVLRPTAETGWRRPRKSAGVTLRVPSQLQ